MISVISYADADVSDEELYSPAYIPPGELTDADVNTPPGETSVLQPIMQDFVETMCETFGNVRVGEIFETAGADFLRPYGLGDPYAQVVTPLAPLCVLQPCWQLSRT